MSTWEELEEHNQLALSARENQEDFAKLYNLYLDPIFGFVKSRVNHLQTAEDLVSDIFYKVFLNLKKFNPKKASFKTWIYTITHNVLIDYYRSGQNPTKSNKLELNEIVHLSDNNHFPDQDLLSQEQKEFVQGCLAKLPERYQKVIQLKYFADLSTAEIAQMLELSENNVRVIIHRALTKLKPLILK